jgi:hypothetical protein
LVKAVNYYSQFTVFFAGTIASIRMTEIPFWVHDRPKWVSGITKSTTCQDVLHALVLTERRAVASSKSSSKSKEEEAAAREVSRVLALVEQWRGVERPLSNSSRILKLWLAWGEERSQVRFVVKRISTSSSGATASSAAAPVTNPTRTRSRARRRNSRAASVTSDTKKADTVHPNLLKDRMIHRKDTKSSDLERLMRIILTQGETIHWQLRKLQEREGQIDTIEQEVHDTRTKTAGKDYLLNAYLNQDHQKKTKTTGSLQLKSHEALEATDSLQEVLDALSKVFKLNEQIQDAEEKANDLQCQLTVSQTGPDPAAKPLEMMEINNELQDLRSTNDKAGQEIDYNRSLISSMRWAYDERKALMDKLEQDVDNTELEGERLQQELQALQSRRQQNTLEILGQVVQTNPNDDIDDTEDEEEEPILFAGGFLDDTKTDGHYDVNILTSEQLYEGPTQEPSVLYDELQRRLRIKTSTSCTLDELRLQSPDTNRIKATGSPGSNSSSGNSSGSGASYEKSVRFSDRELILSTPELPPDLPSSVQQQQHPMSKAKSILKPGDPGTNVHLHPDNTDSNSDTGLSSLHSSSDEGTYVLDTLV